MPQKKVEIAVLQLDMTHFDCINDLNCLGIALNNHLHWHTNTSKTTNTIYKTIRILNKLKYPLPQNILCIMYTSLILTHINYGIILWGHQVHRIFKLQKATWYTRLSFDSWTFVSCHNLSFIFLSLLCGSLFSLLCSLQYNRRPLDGLTILDLLISCTSLCVSVVTHRVFAHCPACNRIWPFGDQ